MKEYASGMVWGEGPRWHDGALWLSDTQGSRLWTDASGAWRSTEVDSPSNGLWFLPDGRLVGAMMHEGRIGEWDGSQWQSYADLAALNVGPLGDMTGDASGNLYVDDIAYRPRDGEAPRPGHLILVRPDKTAEVVADDVDFPNGLAFIDGGKTLVVVETARQQLTAFAVLPDARLGARHVYADISALVGPSVRPDGIWPAEDGIWVATLDGLAVVRVGEGQLLETVDLAPLYPIACCLRDDGSLLVTAADTHGLPRAEALSNKSVATSVVLIDPTFAD